MSAAQLWRVHLLAVLTPIGQNFEGQVLVVVHGISDELKYALVAGAVAGGGLTVIANAPNPAGVGILRDARVFAEEGISPAGLFLGALPPTGVAIVFFWLLR